MGRFEAYSLNMDMLKESGFFTGVGFGYSEETELSKSTIGAKAFNVFMAVFSSLGFPGFLWLLTGVVTFVFNYTKYLLKTRQNSEGYFLPVQYGLALFVSFFVYGQNSPLHFHPFGWVVIGVTASIYLNREQR
jgi:hypothetical protein